MLIAVLLSFAVSLAAPWLHRWLKGHTHWLLALLPAGLFLYFATFGPVVHEVRAVRHFHPWVPAFGVNLSFLLDGLSLLFALLITGLGTIIVLYAGGYLAGHKDLGRFYLSILLFMSSMLGLVLADNLIALFVFWELTSFTSYLLIGFNHERVEARNSALQALLVTGAGGLALLTGLLLLGIAAGGTFELSEIIAQGDAIRQHPLYMPIFVLVVLGAFTKSAQFPFHFWLPNAMEAPTPVSAYLHSATMVKAGIYLLARLDILLGGTVAWVWTLLVFGGITMFLGAVMALRQTDLKRILAYSTVTALGTLTVLLGVSFDVSVVAVVVFLIVHSLYKGTLFLVAGAIDHETGTRDVLRLGGLWRAMPKTAVAAVLAGLSMAGLPPLFGFIGKELTYKAKLGVEGGEWIFPTVAVLANALTMIAAGILVLRPFFGKLKPTPKQPHEAPFSMWIGPVLLAVIGLVLGLFPRAIGETIVQGATIAILGEAVPMELALWYGLNLALALSVLTMVLGVIGYLYWSRIHAALTRLDPLLSRGPESWYNLTMQGMLWVARVQTQLIQNGSLRFYLFATLTATVGLVGATFFLRNGTVGPFTWPEASYYLWTMSGLIVLATVLVILTRSRLAAVAALGVVGFCIALIFVVLGAPDLAMTQFLVETLIVVIIVLVMQRLPRLPAHERATTAGNVRDGLLAAAAGGTVTLLLLTVLQRPFDPYISQFFAQEAVPGGFGHNVVNVILVDFRALDTLGEIVVIGVAAIGGIALIKLRPARLRRPPELSRALILQTATRFLMLLLLLLSVALLWQGHNLPGGGFIGGLVAAGAFALYMLAYGVEGVRAVLYAHPRRLIAVGLGLAVLSGIFALVVGQSFLTGQWIELGRGDSPLKLGTPLLFDVGVYLVVIGFTLSFALVLEDPEKV